MLSITGVLCYKIIVTPFNMQFDFSSFLSLLLALFSVGLAALFYFKATDTSNSFYDNTYKFSQEVANLLARIESGFGERLKHLDDSYKGISDRFDQLPNRFNIVEAKDELKQEEQEAEKLKKEKSALLEDILVKAQLRDEEKAEFLSQLNEKDARLKQAQSEIENLMRQIEEANKDSHIKHDNKSFYLLAGAFMSYLRNVYSIDIIRSFGENEIRREFSLFLKLLTDRDQLTLLNLKIIDSNLRLTHYGIWQLNEYLKNS